jgi:hypothetical protein
MAIGRNLWAMELNRRLCACTVGFETIEVHDLPCAEGGVYPYQKARRTAVRIAHAFDSLTQPTAAQEVGSP